MTTPAVRPVVAGVDGSDGSLAALRWAADEASRRSAPLWVVHAFDLLRAQVFALEDPAFVAAERRAAGKILDAAVREVRELAGHVEVRPVLESGTASVVLLKQSAQADMVVLGSRGRGDFAGLLLGSTSLQVAMHASCGVVVVRGTTDKAYGPSAGRVVVGTDGSPQSERAVGFAFERAQERGLGITAVRAWQSPTIYISTVPVEEWRRWRAQEQTVLAESLAPWRKRYPGVDVVEKSVPGEPAQALVDESAGAELLVVGSHGRGGFGGLLLGSVSHDALHHAHCPVAVLRQ
jgi:nucleotide-binding universal stress UspA family protein